MIVTSRLEEIVRCATNGFSRDISNVRRARNSVIRPLTRRRETKIPGRAWNKGNERLGWYIRPGRISREPGECERDWSRLTRESVKVAWIRR